MKIKAFIITIIAFFGVHTASLMAQTRQDDYQKIKKMIEKKRRYNKKYGFGYTIQLYNGNEHTAKKISAKFRVEYPGTKVFLKYIEPEWKIQAGIFKTKLEADKALLEFRENFSGAIVIPF